MTENTTIAKRILQFNEALANSSFDLPEGYRTVNPYSGDQSELVQKITTAFYQKYYNEVNCNYYENKKLQEALRPFILESLQNQIDCGIDTSVCYCIGSGENFNFLSKINDEHHFFGTIIPLEHPRFIMQYNSKNKDVYMEKYLCALKNQ
ncbi:DUF4918 family protein [Listeria monocytogenes]|uniref:uracil-DNA glycosylase family protein n=1 Tax=Listeria monocytogenes TaxID=1639 RepID=UPI00086E7169|nr:uracil-DNA glycosylase family protein [Listeria monocytogenes]EAC7843918.1 DUF4918 family protein [Listeria monocytogenes]EAD3477171.1 DUF4918 family protein [Listeria monocytogenes]EAD5257405.1 DUF4918 family protein [Listeria monocytogenes]EAE6035026.1 DUF4918 family protein [Listeria monocytogenes]EAE7318789.1 DUF4918 family protein [Listeria monocytogenes]